MNTIKFYHGTSQENVEKIFAEGLKGGDNSKGGTHGSWEEPTLFLAVNDWVAQKYGTVIEITLTEEQLDELGARRIIDGLGDECYIIEGEKGKFDEILIPAKYLSQLSNNDLIALQNVCGQKSKMVYVVLVQKILIYVKNV